MNRRRAVVIRGSDWDATQAAPRAAETLYNLGFDVSILCWDMSGKKPARELVGRGYELRRFRCYIPPRSVRYFLAWPFWWAWLLWRLLRGRYALVHTMNVDTLVPTLLGKALAGFRIIYDIRDALGMALSNVRFPVPQFFTMMDRVLSPMVDGLLLSQGDIAACARFFGRRAARRLPVVQVLNVPQDDPPAVYRTPAARPLRVNFSGFISPGRGAFHVIQAFGQRDDVRIDVVGEIRHGSLRKAFEVIGNATLYGRVPHEEAMQLLDLADVVMILYDSALMTTRVCSANKMFESMMLGKPYLGTAGGWPARVAERFGLGWAVPYGDVEALREMAEKLNADPALLAAAGRRGRQCYEKFFTWPRQRANVLALYRHVLGEGPAGPGRACEGWKRFLGTYLDLKRIEQ